MKFPGKEVQSKAMGDEEKKEGEGQARPGGGIDLKHRESVLLEMSKSLRAASIYSSGHPQRANLLGQAYGAIQVVLQLLGDLSLSVTRAGFLYDDVKLAENQALAQELAQEMHLRQVKSFSLRKELSLEDFTAFLELLLEDPEKFRQGRFIEDWIRNRQIKTVWINEMDFSKLSAAEGPTDLAAEAEKAVPAEQQISEVLALLERENDPEKVGQLLREIEILLRAFMEAKSYEYAAQVVATLEIHAEPGRRPGTVGEQVRAITVRTLRAVVRGDFLQWLLDRYGAREGRERENLMNLFVQVGPVVIDEAVTLMAKRESISQNRPLMDLVLSFGPEARTALEGYLKDEDPARVRRALFLLGELHNKKSVDAVKKMLEHEDEKVRREAVRALVRLRGMDASRALAGALMLEKDAEVRTMIVSALGESRDLAGAPALINLLKTVPPSEDSITLLSAVIESLGRIGSKEALPHLIKILNKWSLFKGGLYLPLRLKAAESLGRLGGESAMQALARYARGKDDPLQQTCAKVLEALIKNNGKPVENIEAILK